MSSERPFPSKYTNTSSTSSRRKQAKHGQARKGGSPLVTIACSQLICAGSRQPSKKTRHAFLRKSGESQKGEPCQTSSEKPPLDTISEKEPVNLRDTNSHESSSLFCLTCTEAITKFMIGCCDHRVLCWRCGIRLRQLYSDDRCCLCKVCKPTYFRAAS